MVGKQNVRNSVWIGVPRLANVTTLGNALANVICLYLDKLILIHYFTLLGDLQFSSPTQCHAAPPSSPTISMSSCAGRMSAEQAEWPCRDWISRRISLGSTPERRRTVRWLAIFLCRPCNPRRRLCPMRPICRPRPQFSSLEELLPRSSSRDISNTSRLVEPVEELLMANSSRAIWMVLSITISSTTSSRTTTIITIISRSSTTICRS